MGSFAFIVGRRAQPVGNAGGVSHALMCSSPLSTGAPYILCYVLTISRSNDHQHKLRLEHPPRHWLRCETGRYPTAAKESPPNVCLMVSVLLLLHVDEVAKSQLAITSSCSNIQQTLGSASDSVTGSTLQHHAPSAGSSDFLRLGGASKKPFYTPFLPGTQDTMPVCSDARRFNLSGCHDE